ncbi:type II secretion system protein [Calycomorphotria hydatis]|uniref:Prepilin-type N-terminal cleavage/methylation domain-containing protein n=1 Tax=Calycomorphotria hydatis TaxID=2528027 RepID=A0A517T5W2_9PLAN|nr:prepilin-type N-terminal cleavage/methylation domain-containing protein [Calycomorphotria hydatis]QDT63759.1 hypothetical protein V22_09840 [Calycomorphotria hydatis]
MLRTSRLTGIHSTRSQSSAAGRGLRRHRAAFTIIELLITISIIVVLATLVTVASMQFLNSAKIAATKSTIQKAQSMLRKRMTAFNRTIENKAVFDRMVSAAGVSGSNEVEQRKGLFRKYFAMNKTEAINNIPLSTSGQLENPVIFYFQLTKGETFGSESVEQEEFEATELAKDANGNQYLVDAWGNPIYFYRWPTKLVLDTSGARDAMIRDLPAQSDRDPDNPLLKSVNYSNYHDANAWHTPLLVSAGPDGLLGLDLPDVNQLANVTDAIETQDNITNLNNQAGATK